MENGDRINIHERIRAVEVCIEAIMNNHLPHIQKTIDGLNKKFWAVILLLVSNLVGIIMTLL